MVEVTNRVIVERIANLKEFFQEEFKNNERAHCDIKEMLTQQDRRLRDLEIWKVAFVAKYTVYSAVALFLGSVVSTIAYQIISKHI